MSSDESITKLSVFSALVFLGERNGLSSFPKLFIDDKNLENKSIMEWRESDHKVQIIPKNNAWEAAMCFCYFKLTSLFSYYP